MTATRGAINVGSTGGYASVNGLELYYEVHGTGEPLVLIPGGFMTIDMMGPIVPSLAQTRQVIAIEPQAHGHTADIDRALTYEQIADDTAALVAHLDLGRVDVFGFSVGANVALQTAIRHPEVVRKLVIVSGTFTSDGVYGEINELMASFDAESPILSANREAYLRAAPTADGWQALVARARPMLTEQYEWTKDVAAIQAPTLIVVGDADTVTPMHAVELFGLLGGGKAESAMGKFSKAQLAVFPGTTEFGILSRLDLLLAIIAPFLDAPMSGAN